ncbi:hypothetical protein H8356DRAFT_1353258 [Neocallimastix lanati (nom. inval.)]|nr:hypothetical protein H8356DRAFT_1353258 [Neocallimastix sp. JGI-2020a]
MSWTKESRTLKIVSEDCPKCFLCCGVNVPSFSHWIFAYSEKDYDINDREQRQLVDNIFKTKFNFVIYFVFCGDCGIDDEMSVDVEMIRHGFSPPGEMTDTDSIDNTNTEIITRNNGRGIIIEEWEKVEKFSFINDRCSNYKFPMMWTVFPGVLIIAFCDSGDNQWLSFLKCLLIQREKIRKIEEDYRKRLIHSKARKIITLIKSFINRRENQKFKRRLSYLNINSTKKTLLSIRRFLKNPHIPIPYKRMLFSAIILVNSGLYWIEGFSNGYSFTSLYCVSKELNIPSFGKMCDCSGKSIKATWLIRKINLRKLETTESSTLNEDNDVLVAIEKIVILDRNAIFSNINNVESSADSDSSNEVYNINNNNNRNNIVIVGLMIERDRNINIRDSENNSIVTNNVVNRSSNISNIKEFLILKKNIEIFCNTFLNNNIQHGRFGLIKVFNIQIFLSYNSIF